MAWWKAGILARMDEKSQAKRSFDYAVPACLLIGTVAGAVIGSATANVEAWIGIGLGAGLVLVSRGRL